MRCAKKRAARCPGTHEPLQASCSKFFGLYAQVKRSRNHLLQQDNRQGRETRLTPLCHLPMGQKYPEGRKDFNSQLERGTASGRGRSPPVCLPRQPDAITRIAMVSSHCCNAARSGWALCHRRTPLLPALQVLLSRQPRSLLGCTLGCRPSLALRLGNSLPSLFAHSSSCWCSLTSLLSHSGCRLRPSLLPAIGEKRLARYLQCFKCSVYYCDQFYFCHR